jgi:uncharacterized surface protein with fasciclin (FAS1) repeats
VHSVGNILIPPVQVFSVVAEHLGKVSQAILLGADFTTLAAAINKADEFAEGAGQATLKSILSDESATLTVFAPVNQVFETAGITLAAFTGEQWYGLIANHVLMETVLAADLSGVYTSAAGSPITVLESGGLDSDGEAGAEATIAVPDAFISQVNGVVHAIAGVLVLPTPAEPTLAGTYASDATACGGDGEGNCDPAVTDLAYEASVELTETDEDGVYLVDDLTFGLYPQGYDIAAVPGEIVVATDGSITITDQLDQYDDPFNGTGQVNEDGSITIEVSNTYGDSIETTLTPSSGRISFAVNNNPKLTHNKK